MTRPIRNAVTIVVDGREIVAPEGTMLHDAAQQGDVEIPVFCYEPKLGEPVGACRMCLVEIEGMPKLQTSCSTPIRDGMVVYTQTDRVKEAQNAVVEFLLVNHPLDCPVCDKGGECPLQDIAMGWGPGKSRFTDPKRHFQKPLELSPLVAIDRERCILCYRCVRFSQEVAEDEQLQLLERGDRSFVGTFEERPYVAPFHGNIIELCPVGALTSYTYRFRARPWDIEQAGSICTLCPSQCNVAYTVRDERVLRVLARDNTEVDDGWLCDKGRFGYQMFSSPERITEPMARAGDGSLSPIGWDEAISRAAAGLRGAGAKSAALLGGGSSNEEGWLVQKLLREGLGSGDIDCGSSAIDPDLLRELSRPELGAQVKEIDYAGAILVLGADPLHEMPILDLRIRKAVRRNGAVLAVASPRPTALDGGAQEAVRYAPGEAPAFVTALSAAVRAGKADGPYADGAREIATILSNVPDPVIVWGERLWREPDTVRNLLDLTATLGFGERIGPGLIEIPSESNGRGLREAGCLAGAGPGLSEGPAGRSAAGIRDGLAAGELRGCLLANVNPVRSHPGSAAWARGLGSAFVVSIADFDDESTRHADVVFPAETHAEKDGTVTHPDGRLQRVRANVPHPGQVRPGWLVLSELGRALGLDLDFEDQPAVLAAMAAEVGTYAGITNEEIGGTGIRWQERNAGRSWTPERADSDGSPSTPPTPSPDQRDGLLLGTYPDLWANEVTERNPALRFLMPAQKLELAPDDAERLGVGQGDQVSVSVNGTSVEAAVSVKARMRAGAAFLIEGTTQGNANLLADGGPATISVSPAESSLRADDAEVTAE
jgi:NADH-quinone oxidoreductase subunit G